MIMNKEKYEDLILRFAKELHEVGVTENMKKSVEAQWIRAPNIVATLAEENTDRFVYCYDGYLIEAIRSVKIVIKKST